MSQEPSRLKVWLNQIRAPFLVLPVLLCLVGGALAWRDGVLDVPRLLLCMLGTLLAHVAVNLFNEHSDHRTGIDFRTQRTPFSGGSGTLQAGLNTPRAVYLAAVGTLLAALAIGVYLALTSGPELFVLIVIGGLATVFYTTHLTRFMLGELTAGICLGSFVVLGTYFAMAGRFTSEAVLLSVPPGILTALLLFLNEFPDAEADRSAGRRHLVIVLGHGKAARLYTAALAVMYLWIAAGVIAGLFPGMVAISLLTLPIAAIAVRQALFFGSDVKAMVPGLAANVLVVLGTDLLLAVGYFVG
ncbi:MAG: prenyltransferase [Myxococcales bacterium]|nr:prenyltransferase [Myxococcales bacterium]